MGVNPLVSTARCVVVLGGSFDPVHAGHVALGKYFWQGLQADELRIIPAASPWQKGRLQASAEHRIAMLQKAFAAAAVPIVLDLREVQQDTNCYSVDTLRALRAECGPQVSLVFVLGADQLRQLHTWHAWRELFSLAHVAAGSRPGFALAQEEIHPQVAQEIAQRAGSMQEVRAHSHGLTLTCSELALDISATEIRRAIREGSAHDGQQARKVRELLPAEVLDYIQQHHLYQK